MSHAEFTEDSMFVKFNNGQVMIAGNSGRWEYETSVGERDKPDKPHELKIWRQLEDKPVSFVACGPGHVVVICMNKAYVMGDNKDKQLGLKGVKSDYVKKLTLLLPKKDFVMAACSKSFTMLITLTGSLWAAGTSRYGELGCYESQQIYITDGFMRVLNLPRIKDVSCGRFHCMAVDYDTHKLYGWGNPQNGRLGFPSSFQIPVLIPTEIVGGKQTTDKATEFKMVACSNSFSLAIDIDGYLWYAGTKKYEQNLKGEEVCPLSRFEPRKSSTYHYISAGPEFALLFMKTGDIYFMGERNALYMNIEPKPKDDRNSYHSFARKIDRFSEAIPAQSDAVVTCGFSQLAIIDQERLFTWGNTEQGKCGLSLEDARGQIVVKDPTLVTIPKSKLDNGATPSSARNRRKKNADSVDDLQGLQLSLKNLPKTMTLAAIYEEDNSLAKEFDGISNKSLAEWRKAKETNMKYKVLLKLFLTILFKKGKER
jgi:alpha-tubulin suppressor-like RCC1 family protein